MRVRQETQNLDVTPESWHQALSVTRRSDQVIRSGECFNSFNAYNQEQGFSVYRQESETG